MSTQGSPPAGRVGGTLVPACRQPQGSTRPWACHLLEPLIISVPFEALICSLYPSSCVSIYSILSDLNIDSSYA